MTGFLAEGAEVCRRPEVLGLGVRRALKLCECLGIFSGGRVGVPEAHMCGKGVVRSQS